MVDMLLLMCLPYLSDFPKRFVEQAWQTLKVEHDDEWGDGGFAEDIEGEEIECVVCQKTFKSERAWNNHEQSRKHIKEVEL